MKSIEDINYDILMKEGYVESLPEHLRLWVKDYIMPDYQAINYIDRDKDGNDSVLRGNKLRSKLLKSTSMNNRDTMYHYVRTFCTNTDIKASLVADLFAIKELQMVVKYLYEDEGSMHFAPADVKKMCYCITGERLE